MYFNSIEEAYEWLDPEESYREREIMCAVCPEQYDEWLKWVAAGHLLDGNGRDL